MSNSDSAEELHVPQTEPARCRDEGSEGPLLLRGCPWTPPGWSQPWLNTRCASQAVPVPTWRRAESQLRESPPHLAPLGAALTFPHGESQEGSPGLEAFHRAKSLGDFFSLSLSAEMLRSPAAAQISQHSLNNHWLPGELTVPVTAEREMLQHSSLSAQSQRSKSLFWLQIQTMSASYFILL